MNEILFKTNDGVDIKIGDQYWYVGVGHHNAIKVFQVHAQSWQDARKGFAQFSTQELAESHKDILIKTKNNEK